MRILGIYLIINSENGKIYIGSSIDIEGRFYEHCYHLNLGNHKNPKLQAAWNFYGADAFHFCIVEECSLENLLSVEQAWLDGSFGENCYNVSPTAGNTFGKACSKETKLKISEANKGRKRTNEVKTKMKCRQHSIDNLKFINDWGLNFTPEAKAKIKISLLGNQRNRKSDKWPHGCECKCQECKTKRTNLAYEWKRNKILGAEF